MDAVALAARDARRLRYEFEDRTSGASENGESQDWFVNDKRDDSRTPSPTKSEVTARDGERQVSNSGQPAPAPSVVPVAAPALGPQVLTSKAPKLTMKKPNAGDDATDQDTDECGASTGKTAFLHHIPHVCGILVMELGIGDQVRRTGVHPRDCKCNDVESERCCFVRLARPWSGATAPSSFGSTSRRCTRAKATTACTRASD